MSQSNFTNKADAVREEMDDYEQNIAAIISLAHIVEYDLKGKSFIVPSMETSASNAIQPNTAVTPDMRGEINSYGIIGEIKRSFPKNQEHWTHDLDQLKKYDDNLTGWENDISMHDISVVTDILRSFALWKYINGTDDSNRKKFTRNISVLEFVRKQDRNVFYTIKKSHGQITNSTLDTLLSNGVGIPARNIIQKLSRIKFYDSEPPLIHTMTIIWDHILKGIPEEAEFRDSQGRRTISLDVEIKDIVKELRSHYCPSENPAVLQESWVKKALEAFVRVGLAKRYKTNINRYTINFHRIKGGMTTDYLLAKLYGEGETKLDDYFQTD